MPPLTVVIILTLVGVVVRVVPLPRPIGLVLREIQRVHLTCGDKAQNVNNSYILARFRCTLYKLLDLVKVM